jgi:hypothetical protein
VRKYLSFVAWKYFDESIFRRDRELIALMGNTELVASDHAGVIDAGCIEGEIYIYIYYIYYCLNSF